MTTYFTKSIAKRTKQVFSYALILVGLLTIQSCSKTEDQPIVIPGFLAVVNTSPTSATFNFYLNDIKVNQQALPFQSFTNYVRANPGDYTAKFTTASNTDPLISRKVSLPSNQASTLYLIGKAPQLDYYITNDDLSKQTTKAFIRFVNLSPDAPALNLAVKGGADLITGQAFKNSSAFLEVDAKAYEFDVKAAGQVVPGGSIPSATLVAGRYYTVLVSGLITPGTGEQAFKGIVFQLQAN